MYRPSVVLIIQFKIYIIIGLAEPLPNILSINDLEVKKSIFLNTLNIADRVKIELDTQEQSESEKWFQE